MSNSEVLHSAWVDNGPGWLGLVLDSPETLLGLRPDFAAMGALKVGVIARHSDGHVDAEVRAFVPGLGIREDPVTGSLNAGFAVWLTSIGVLPPSYTVRQGTAIGRDGRVSVTTLADEIWVGGACTTRVRGTLEI